MKKFVFVISGLMLATIFATQVKNAEHAPVSNYVGQENWTLKSLSPDDIAELRRGGGWGLAKAAELNGVPGPAHLLELKDDIPLDVLQIAAITEIFERMKTQAILQGETLIALEQELELHFQNQTITDAILLSSLDAIAATRRDLRYIHLATHLKTPEILSVDQIARYNALWGYSELDSCANPPEGHDADMWRKNHGCE